MSFAGAKVLSLESRRSKEIAQLIRNHQGDPFVAPSMREAPLERNDAAFQFAEKLFAGGFDMVVLLTGVGTRLLDQVLATRYPAGRFAEALRGLTVVARGPKPMAVLREMNVPAKVLATTEGRAERRIAVQEHGKSSPELIDGFRARGADVTAVPVYQWDLPEDTEPLREAARRVATGEFHVALFTTSIQIAHLFRVAAEDGIEPQVRDGFSKILVASIGPATSEALEEYGVRVDFEPSHPKMGVLVQETASRMAAMETEKR